LGAGEAKPHWGPFDKRPFSPVSLNLIANSTMQLHIHSKPSRGSNPLPQGGHASHRAIAGEALEFSRFCVLLRQRQLLADGVPVELGTRAFDLLLVLLEADGLLVTKEELVSRVWPSVVVTAENVRVHVSALRKALGADRDHPYGVRPRLPIHRRTAHEQRNSSAKLSRARKAAVCPHPSLHRKQGRVREGAAQMSALVPECQFVRLR
jgi:hypothetical protein